jgi:hypothetical protein
LMVWVCEEIWSPSKSGGVLDDNQKDSVAIRHTFIVRWQLKNMQRCTQTDADFMSLEVCRCRPGSSSITASFSTVFWMQDLFFFARREIMPYFGQVCFGCFSVFYQAQFVRTKKLMPSFYGHGPHGIVPALVCSSGHKKKPSIYTW